MSYKELVKKRIISGDTSRPDDLYPLLLKELRKEKEIYVLPFIRYLLKGSQFDHDKGVLDVGGHDGFLIHGAEFEGLVVVDKKVSVKYDDVEYHEELFNPGDLKGCDTIIFSDVLHTMTDEKIEYILNYVNVWSRNIIVIEEKYDDFLDLRLRIYGAGKCINEGLISKCLGCDSVPVGNHNIWVNANG